MLVNCVLVYLAIGALIWALLVAHAAARHGWRSVAWTLALCLFKWPLYLARLIRTVLRDLRDIETMRRHCR